MSSHLPELNPIPTSLNGKQENLRLGIIGLGTIGRLHLKAATNSHLWHPIAVADSRPLHGLDFDNAIPLCDGWQELLEHPEVDAVSVCVPHYLHASITEAALQVGKHVLVEKPLSMTVDEGRSLIECAAVHGRTLMVELTHRFYPVMRDAHAFMQQEGIGHIYAVEDRIVEPAGPQIQPWLKSRQLAGGGVALTNGVHMLDRIAFMTGQSLNFESGQAGYSAKLGDVEDTAAMSLSLENGAPVHLLAAWPLGTGPSDDELTIYGTRGTLRIWAWRGWRFEPAASNEPAVEKICHQEGEAWSSRIQQGVANALDEFGRTILTGIPPVASAQVALDSQTLIEQFYRYVAAHQL